MADEADGLEARRKAQPLYRNKRARRTGCGARCAASSAARQTSGLRAIVERQLPVSFFFFSSSSFRLPFVLLFLSVSLFFGSGMAARCAVALFEVLSAVFLQGLGALLAAQLACVDAKLLVI